MAIDFKVLGRDDGAVLGRVAPDVFDAPVAPHLTAEFLADPRHHLVVALDEDVVVGFASALHYVHPDKQPELWINEIAVAGGHRQRGVGKELLRHLFEVGRALGCRQAWVLTDRFNDAAMRLYTSVGGDPGEHEHVMFEFQLDRRPAA